MVKLHNLLQICTERAVGKIKQRQGNLPLCFGTMWASSPTLGNRVCVPLASLA